MTLAFGAEAHRVQESERRVSHSDGEMADAS